MSQDFGGFGGIIRDVICSEKAFERRREKKQIAIRKVDFKVLLQDPNIEQKEVSHYIMSYKVHTEGATAYEKVDHEFVNRDVFEAVRDQALSVSLSDMIMTLIRYEETGAQYAEYLAPYYFERLIADGLQRGMKWVRFVGGDLQKIETEKSFTVRKEAVGISLDTEVKKVADGLPPCFADMGEGVLYRSTNPNFKAFDMLCRTKCNQLLCIQVKAQRADYVKIDEKNVIEKLEELRVPEDAEVRFAIVVLPKRVKECRFNINFQEGRKLGVEVWRVGFE